jgi:type II secretory pathway pseudopilin PulG
MRGLKKTLNNGFTLIEMLVVAPIVILAIGAFLTVIITMVGDVLASRASNTLTYDVQDALNRIEQDVKLSSGFLATNSVIGTAQGRGDDATAFMNIDAVVGPSLILNMVATTANPLSTTSSYVFLKDKPNSCANAQGFNTPFTYNVVYFLNTDATSGITSLFRRTLMPINYADTTNTVCAVPWQQPSCSPDYMDAQTGSVFCRTNDIVMVRGITPDNFIVQYFNSEDASLVNVTASTIPQVEDRAIALQSVTTVGVSINAEQEAAGRTIERSATLRVSRLDTNASSIGSISADGAPAAPIISSTTGEPTTVTFSWPAVAAASGYTLEYEVNNSGTWVVGGTSNSTARTFTLSSATHNDIVKARVTAIGPGGSTTSPIKSVTIPLWTPLNLQNGWVDYAPPYSSAGYTKTAAGVILLKGMVRSGTGIIGTLPVGYRPAMYSMFENSTNSAPGRVDVQSDGNIRLSVGSNAWYSLDGISFMPSGTTFISPTFSNGWLNYSPGSGSPDWQGAGYMLDGAGRVQTTGLVRAGVVTSGTTMFNIPNGFRPPQYLHMLNNAGGSANHFSVDASGNMLAKGGSAVYQSLQGMYFPAGRATGSNCATQWCALPMVNGWKHYANPYSTPQYTKSSDGVVILKGLLNGGSSATATIATLPAGFCPAERLLFATVSNAAWARLDVSRSSNGTCDVLPLAGASTVWFALDNIRYVAEP